jgi:hypothetical protein
MKSAILSALPVAIIFQTAFVLAGCRTTPQSGLVGKWQNADGTYVVDFRSSGDCSVRFYLQGHELGGPCAYTVDKDDITLRWHRPEPGTSDDSKNASVKWHYTLTGDVLTATVSGNSVTFQRAH